MGKVTILPETTKAPITLIGKCAGICYGSDTSDPVKNFNRGIDCIKSQHGRALEYPQIYMVLDDYSARVIREFYTHIGGMPTRLQASTRYINYEDLKYYTPPSIAKDLELVKIYDSCMDNIMMAYEQLLLKGVSREDAANLLPLGMNTKIVVRTNVRNLMDMSRQRMCNRAYEEFRKLFTDIIEALNNYGVEWQSITSHLFHPKCEELGYCPEKYGCGLYPKREE